MPLDFSCSITIPIYKSKPDYVEVASFKQAVKILNKYPFILLCPENLNVSIYEKILKHSNINYQFRFLDKKWFKGRNTYSSLFFQDFFYDLLETKFFLIYQLDAWVFRDELEYWCKKNYAFIGAPVFLSGGFYPFLNGGLSLRRVSKMKLAIKLLKYSIDVNMICGKFSFFEYKQIFEKKEWQKMPAEDHYFSFFASRFLDNYKIPKFEDSIKFSIESENDKLFNLNKKQLPFGVHAFERMEPWFWQKFVPVKFRLSNFKPIDDKSHKINLILPRFTKNKSLYIWSAGLEGRYIFNELKNANIIGFLDGNFETWGRDCMGCKIFNPKEVLSDFKSLASSLYVIVGSFKYSKEIVKELKSYGLKKNKDFFVPFEGVKKNDQ
ncbi:MAG: hypothetical protein LBU89_03375 [Fibromonadaceae bacterium]|jgi:hypothetical protein|nr:hypothetical protein [Fibromonadaceae bacterium]